MSDNSKTLPEDVPHQTEVGHSPNGEQAVVRFELSSLDVIPTVEFLVEPVTPVRDFDIARYSFVEPVDVIASLDSRPISPK